MRILIQNCAVARLFVDSENYSLYILLCNYTPALVICLVFFERKFAFFYTNHSCLYKIYPFPFIWNIMLHSYFSNLWQHACFFIY